MSRPRFNSPEPGPLAMNDDRQPRLTLVASEGRLPASGPDDDADAPPPRDIDWTILMARAQEGDAAAYLRLLQEITPYVRSLVRRWHRQTWDVEDTVQDILLTVHAIRHTYDPARPFGPWLVGIANRRAIDRLRLYGRRNSREAPLENEHEAFVAASQDADGALDRRHLDQAIEHLPLVQQKAVNLLKLKEMSLKEASLETGMSVAALKMATHRALRTLRTLLSDREDK